MTFCELATLYLGVTEALFIPAGDQAHQIIMLSKFFSQRATLDLHPTRLAYGNSYRKYKVLVAEDPETCQWKHFPEADELHNRNSCDSNMS